MDTVTEIMTFMFFNAKSFNFKDALDIAWASSTGYIVDGAYASPNIFKNSCSVKNDCGKCGKKQVGTTTVPVTCSASKVGTTAATPCTFCADHGLECCGPTCDNIDGSSTVFSSSSCPDDKVLRFDLSVFCPPDGCTATHCCLTSGTTKLPNGCGECNSGGINEKIKDWIIGGAAKDAVIHLHGLIQNWDTSDVTRMDWIFYGKKTFNDGK